MILHEDRYQQGLKMTAQTLPDDLHSFFMSKRLFIWTFGDKGVINIGESHNSRSEWYLLPFQPLRIPGSIPFS